MEVGGLARQARDTAAALVAAAGAVTSTVEQVHDAVSGRAYRLVGPIADPVAAVHAAVARVSFGAVEAGRAGAGHVAQTLAATVPDRHPAVGDTGPPAAVLAAVGGLWGDRLAASAPSLTAPITLRRRGRPVALDGASLAAAYPDATDRLVVLVHGLCGTEQGWRTGPGHTFPGYGPALRRDLACTALFVRYTSGRHVSDSGADLAALLAKVVQAWPVRVRSVALVGHSMGGLVARSACHQATGEPWTGLVTHVVGLGTPHLGAPLEKGVHTLSWALARFPESAPFAGLLDARSAGVTDLRFGSVVTADWVRDELLVDRCTDAALPPHVRGCWVASTASARPDSLAGRAVGDLLVRVPSASGAGRRRRLPFGDGDGVRLAGVDHLALLRSPLGYAHVRAWLTADGAVTEGAGPARPG
jgi:hypothetical protein